MSVIPESAAIVNALRSGVVPNQGLEHFATGLEPLLGAVNEELDFVATGQCSSKWLRGEYGAGKTFAARYLCTKARERGFATAEVQISKSTPLHQLEAVYRSLVERIETAADGPNAFRAVVEGWLYRVGDEVTRLRGLAEDDPGFADATEQRLEDKLADLSRRNPAFAQVLRAYHRATHEGDFGMAQGLLAWLMGTEPKGAAIARTAGANGRIDGQVALTFLGGVLQLLRQSGYQGLLVVVDEVEIIQRLPRPMRESSLTALRQLVDTLGNGELPGLYLMVLGTRDFFEGYKGLKSVAALHQRVHVTFGEDPRWDNLRAPQVRLLPFTGERLLTVGRRVRDLYPAKNPGRVAAHIDDRFLEALVEQVTAGFGGKVSLAPRLFLRELVDVMDRVDLHADYVPAEHYRLVLNDGKLNDEELAAKHGTPIDAAAEEAPEEPPVADKPRRLEG